MSAVSVLSDGWRPVWSDPHTDRLNRLVPPALLAVSVAMMAIAVASGLQDWPRFFAALPVAGVTAGWIVVANRSARSASVALRSAGFAVYFLLAAALVGFSPWYGVFAWTAFLMVDLLPRRLLVPALVAIGLVLAGSQSGSYPTTWGHLWVYLLLAAVDSGLAIALVTVAHRMQDQHEERGRMIAELAEANQRLEATMAENAGLHAQLLAQAREAGVHDERQRLAGEIHDTLAQSFTGIVTQLEAALQARRLDQQWSRHVAQAQQLARGGLTEARRSVRALRPEQLERAGLGEAILALGREWSESSGVPARGEIVGQARPIDPDVAAALFRVAQESLTNIAKHAHPAKVAVTLTYLEDTVLLDVRDDGTGFDPAGPSSGFGLPGMRERLARAGGTLTIETAPGQGTAVNAAVPLVPA